LSLPAKLADEGVEGRREKKPEASHTDHSEEHGGSKGLPHFGAGTCRHGERRDARMNAKDVIKIGRSRVRAA